MMSDVYMLDNLLMSNVADCIRASHEAMYSTHACVHAELSNLPPPFHLPCLRERFMYFGALPPLLLMLLLGARDSASFAVFRRVQGVAIHASSVINRLHLYSLGPADCHCLCDV